MNHGIFIIKVLENPKHLVINETPIIKVSVKFTSGNHKLSNFKLTLVLWGGFREDFINYYKVKDYLLVEGIVTSKGETNEKNKKEEVNLIAKRVYPFLLD